MVHYILILMSIYEYANIVNIYIYCNNNRKKLYLMNQNNCHVVNIFGITTLHIL